jgi:hypothetical protein
MSGRKAMRIECDSVPPMVAAKSPLHSCSLLGTMANHKCQSAAYDDPDQHSPKKVKSS